MNGQTQDVPDRLSPKQKELWDRFNQHLRKGAGRQGTARQRVNLAIDAFLFWLDFEGIGPAQPGPEAIKADFDAAGIPELCPDEHHLEEMRRHPEFLWHLAPGRARRR